MLVKQVAVPSWFAGVVDVEAGSLICVIDEELLIDNGSAVQIQGPGFDFCVRLSRGMDWDVCGIVFLGNEERYKVSHWLLSLPKH